MTPRAGGVLGLADVSSRLPWALVVTVLACTSSNSKSSETAFSNLVSDSVWEARLRNAPCRRPSIQTSHWPVFTTARGSIGIRIPPDFRQDPYDHALKTAERAGRLPPNASAWDAKPGFPHVQFTIGPDTSAKLVFTGPHGAEESICVESIDGAPATIGSYKWTSQPGDEAYLGPYLALGTVQFQNGLTLRIFGAASTRQQREEILAAIRTMHRVHRD